MKKWLLLILSIMMMALPVLAEAAGSDPVQEAKPIAYTVEFTWNGNQHVMAGDSSVRLSEIMDTVGLTGQVTDAAVSDDSLFSVSNETGEWIVTAHRAFHTTEWMRVTIDGAVREITVTDADMRNIPYIEKSWDGTKVVSTTKRADVTYVMNGTPL